MNNTSNINQLIDELVYKLKNTDFSKTNWLIGFDGFVDEVVHVVKKRIDADTYERELKLEDYGSRITATAGLSSNVEIVTISQKIGGNGPIMANSLCEYGVKPTYIGALGYPEINPIFTSLSKKCSEVVSVANPASTDAVEFINGKIIRCKLSSLNELNYKTIIKRIGIDKLTDLVDNNEIIGFMNWSLINYANDIYKGILYDVIPKLKNNTTDKILFFDLADPNSRTEKDINEILSIINSFGEYYNTILGLNLREAIQICNIFEDKYDIDNHNLQSLCSCIMDNMNINQVVIHPVDQSCCMTDDGKFYNVLGPYCENPVLTTGAGDNFNAGFLLCTTAGFKPEICLLAGMATSGFYVRSGRSGNTAEIINFLESWQKNQLD